MYLSGNSSLKNGSSNLSLSFFPITQRRSFSVVQVFGSLYFNFILFPIYFNISLSFIDDTISINAIEFLKSDLIDNTNTSRILTNLSFLIEFRNLSTCPYELTASRNTATHLKF
ncbi:TPA: hypothetical protein DEG21_06025 [Patescibacteria group bacterium]|nr:hypothetical protein [Candidatus Gracilibacteria bacterium]